MKKQLTTMRRQGPQKVREILVFGALFALPFAGAFAVEPWAAFLLCPLGVVGLLGLNEAVGVIPFSGLRRDDDRSAGR